MRCSIERTSSAPTISSGSLSGEAIGFDTNVLLRSTLLDDPAFEEIAELVASLRAQGRRAVCTDQSLRELYRIATGTSNGLALGVEAGLALTEDIHRDFPVLRPTEATFDLWHRLLRAGDVRGPRTHDAHVAATLLSRGVRTIVTLDRGFRFAGLESLSPGEALARFGV